MAVLREQRCGAMQGYLITAPMQCDEVDGILQSRSAVPALPDPATDRHAA